MEYFSRKLGVPSESDNSANMIGGIEIPRKSGVGGLGNGLDRIKKENDDLRQKEEKLSEIYAGLQERTAELLQRKAQLYRRQEVVICRSSLLEKQEKNLENNLGQLLEKKEYTSELQLRLDSKTEELELLKDALIEKKDMVINKKKQLYQRRLEVKNMTALLEDAVAEKHESTLNHIVYHSKEIQEIKEMCLMLPTENLRLSTLCKEQLDEIGNMKNRQAGIYAVDLKPSNSTFVNVQHLKKKINKQKRKNLFLFNRIKQLHQKSNIS